MKTKREYLDGELTESAVSYQEKNRVVEFHHTSADTARVYSCKCGHSQCPGYQYGLEYSDLKQ